MSKLVTEIMFRDEFSIRAALYQKPLGKQFCKMTARTYHNTGDIVCHKIREPRWNPIVERLSREEKKQLIQAAYRDKSEHGLLIKTLFQTGARVLSHQHSRA